jgi:uncharacterized protein (DUF433 family)
VHRRFAERALEPRYRFPEAARLVERPTETIRRWAIGHQRLYQGRPATDEPLIQIDGSAERDRLPLSFLNLIELRFLASYRQGVSLPAIRRALEFAAHELGVDRPLLEVEFATHGRELFLRYAEEGGEQYFLNASRRGQVAWPEDATLLLESLEYDAGEHAAYRWWPLGKQRPVLLDTRLNGGRPSTAEAGVRTVAIATRANSGWSIGDIAADVAASTDEVEAALQLERAA